MPSVARQPQNKGTGDGRFRRLTNILYDQLTESDTSDYRVGEQRERNYRYYALQPLGNEIKGRSQYISPDVFDVVESKKAYFREIFLSSRQPIKFMPDEHTTQEEADARTAYVRSQLRKNDIVRLFRDGWHDAFVAKRMIVLAEWMDDDREVEQEVPGATVQAIQQALEADPDIQSINTDQLEQGPNGMVQGTLVVTKDNSRVKLTLVEPERWYRDPTVAYLDEAMYAGYEEDVPRAILIERGYDPEQVQNLTSDWRYRREQEDNSRKNHDSSWTRRRLHNRTAETENVTLRRTWAWIALGDHVDSNQPIDMGARPQTDIDFSSLGLYEIHWVDGDIMRKADGTLCIKPADEIPAFEWTEHKVSHAEHGMATSDVVAHTQKTNSVLKRLVIDNQQMINTTRYEAVQGMVKNPRELLDNNIGGVVWSSQPGSVQPLATPQLSPLTMNAIEMLDQDKEERSGVSRLAQGLNTDVIRHQNASDMVERLTNNANRRITQAARDFAEDFYVGLAKYIVKLGARHDRRTYQIEIAGKQVQYSPYQWQDDDIEMSVHTALTPEESAYYAQTLMTMHQLMSMDQNLSMAYGINQKHALFDEVFDALGVPDTSRFLMRPDSEEFNQNVQGIVEQQQAAQQAADEDRKVRNQTVLNADRREDIRVELEKFGSSREAADTAADNIRADDQQAHDMKIDIREQNRKDKELQIERQQTRSNNA